MRSLLLLSLLFISPCFAKNKPVTLNVDSIISRSVRAYAHLKTYTDSGKVIQSFIGNNPHKTAKIFKTAYASTGDINFEYYEPGKSNSLYTINRVNNVTKTWWGINNRTEPQLNILRALGGAAGVSASTSMIVPELLLSADFKNVNFYNRITQRLLAGEEEINGNMCYKITGTDLQGPIAIWIAKKDFLIRNIETETVIDPAKSAARNRKMEASLKGRTDSAGKQYLLALQTVDRIHKADSLRGIPRTAFTVKATYSFFPVLNNKVNPELLKFRPNREVAL